MSTNPLSQQLSRLCLRTNRFLIVTLGTAAIAHGQPGQSPSIDASFRFSAQSDTEFGGAKHGEIETSSLSFSTETSRALSEKLSLKLGLNYQEIFIEATNAVPIPDSLRTAEIELGATWSFSSQLSASLIARPGISADGESFDGDGFNIPGMLLTRWQVNRTLTLLGGAIYDSFSEDEITPFFGLRWQASPRVVLMLGAPRTEISYELREGHKLFAAASFQGGNYHVDDHAVMSLAGYPSLRDTEVSYREIYLGAGYAWPLTKNLSAEIEAGWMADRRFDYNDRGLVVKTDGAPTARFSLNARF